MTVYLDILLFVNIAVNTAILWVSARFLKQNPSPLRFLAALSVCCIYGLAVCFPSLGILMNIFFKVFFACLITLIAFKFKGIRGYLQNLMVFLLVSLTYIACLMVFQYIPVLSDIIYIRNGSVYYNMPIPYILIMTIILCVFQLAVSRFFDKKPPKKSILPCKVVFNGESVNLNCFIDTGNMLKESISGLPVVMIDKKVLRKIIDIDSSGNILYESDPMLYKRFRVVPFKSAGGVGGLLQAFKPDGFYVDEKKFNVIVAVNQTPINSNGMYEGIIPLMN